jgi:hypothetical protein
MNTIENSQLIPSNINYRFYISAANKIVSFFKNKQLTLF